MKTANQTVTATRLVKDAIAKAKHFADYNIFTAFYEERALKRAAEIDERIARGEEVGRLAGVPFVAKNNFLATGGKATASAHILEEYEAPLNATAVAKLEAEGAILIGQANCDAFGHGISTENSYFGVTPNSHDKTRVSGGSSGGPAVAVALDIVEFALATDTGGSIRQPASFNGLYGLKPTYGTISRYGVVPMASSTDCIGFLTKDLDDLDLLMSIAAGRDPKDLTTLPDFYQASPEKSSRDHRRIGVIKDFDNESVAPEIREALKKTCEQIVALGHEIVEIEMPILKNYALAIYYIIVPAEIASNLSRYDGVRYGFRSERANELEALYENTRSEGFMPENKRRILLGNFVLSSGFYDAYFLKAAKARTLLINEYAAAFRDVDYILAPISPNIAYKIGEKTSDPVAMYLEDIMTVPVSLAGLPALAIPAGETKDGIPVGLQLIGPRRSDRRLIEFAEEIKNE